MWGVYSGRPVGDTLASLIARASGKISSDRLIQSLVRNVL